MSNSAKSTRAAVNREENSPVSPPSELDPAIYCENRTEKHYGIFIDEARLKNERIICDSRSSSVAWFSWRHHSSMQCRKDIIQACNVEPASAPHNLPKTIKEAPRIAAVRGTLMSRKVRNSKIGVKAPNTAGRRRSERKTGSEGRIGGHAEGLVR